MKTTKSKMMLKSAMTLFLAVFVSTMSFAQTGTQAKPASTTTQSKPQTTQTKPQTQTGQKLSRDEYVKMMNDRVAAMDKKLTTLKAEAVAKKKDSAPDYQTQLSTTEGQLSTLKTKIGSFKETDQAKVDAFENETKASYKSIEQGYNKLHTTVYGEMKAATPAAKPTTPQNAAPKN